MTTTAKNKEKIRFSKAFWVANTVELFERAAYYGVFTWSLSSRKGQGY